MWMRRAPNLLLFFFSFVAKQMIILFFLSLSNYKCFSEFIAMPFLKALIIFFFNSMHPRGGGRK